MGSSELKLNEFKIFYQELSRGLPPWASFLLLGLLVWIEQRLIQVRVVSEVTKSIKEVEPYLPPSGVPPPVYSETGSDFFDEMRLSAPWKAQEDPSDSP